MGLSLALIRLRKKHPQHPMSTPSPLASQPVSLSLWEVCELGSIPSDASPGSCTQLVCACREPGPLGLPQRVRHLTLQCNLGSWLQAAFGPPNVILLAQVVTPAQDIFGVMKCLNSIPGGSGSAFCVCPMGKVRTFCQDWSGSRKALLSHLVHHAEMQNKEP